MLDLLPMEPAKQWGTLEEQHRRLSFFVLTNRLLYYVHSAPMLTDYQYDQLERYLYWFECHNQVTHARSPWRTVGSSNLNDYQKICIKWAEAILDRTASSIPRWIAFIFTEEWKKFLSVINIPHTIVTEQSSIISKNTLPDLI